MNSFTPLDIARHYFGKLRTLREDLRTERQILALPPSIRKDIGWPDGFVRRGGIRRR